MLVNCTCCGKLISLKKELCPYCMASLELVKQSLELEAQNAPAHAKRRYSFFGLLSR